MRYGRIRGVLEFALAASQRESIGHFADGLQASAVRGLHRVALRAQGTLGNDLEHVKLMRLLRDKLGPDVLTFAEHQCDAILPYSGGYSETTFHAAKPGQEPGYRIWSGLDDGEISRFQLH